MPDGQKSLKGVAFRNHSKILDFLKSLLLFLRRKRAFFFLKTVTLLVGKTVFFIVVFCLELESAECSCLIVSDRTHARHKLSISRRNVGYFEQVSFTKCKTDFLMINFSIHRSQEFFRYLFSKTDLSNGIPKNP